MKPIEYDNNGNGLYVQYHRMREGPNYFLIHYKHSSVLRRDPLDVWRVMGVAKYTDSNKHLKQWCLDIHEKYTKVEPPLDEGRADTSFASEAMKEEEPNDNTKMVV